MKKIFITGLLIILFFILDNAFIPFFAIRHYYPSILFVFIICFSVVNGKWQGLWVGAISGMLQDVFFYNAFGINSLLNMTVCIIAGAIGVNIFKEKRLIPIISTLGLSVFKGLGVYLLLLILGQHTDYKNIFFNATYEMVICVFMYMPIYKLYHKNFMKKDWKF